MRTQFVTIAALAGSAYAGLEAYQPAAPAYGSESSSSVPAYSSASSSPVAPGYGSTPSIPTSPEHPASTTTSEVVVSTTCTEESVTTPESWATVPTYAPSVTPSVTPSTPGSPEQPFTYTPPTESQPPVYGESSSVPPTAPVATPSCPAPGSTNGSGQYSCNPAHSYPAGQTCEMQNGCYYLVYPTPSSTEYSPIKPSETATAPGYGAPPSSGVPSTYGSTPSNPVGGSSSIPGYTAPAPPASTPYSPIGSSSISIPPYAPSVSVPAYVPTLSTVPIAPTAPYGYGNQTIPATGAPSASATHPIAYTGSASKMAGSALVGMLGVVAALFL